MARLPIPGSDDGTLISSALSNAGAEMTSNKVQPSGYAPLDSSSKAPTINLGATGQTSLPRSVILPSLTASSDAYWMALY